METVGLAMNGRKGRRVGCVMMDKEVEVLVMDEEEDEEEEGEEVLDMEGVEE
jgi:hypothetical protein